MAHSKTTKIKTKKVIVSKGKGKPQTLTFFCPFCLCPHSIYVLLPKQTLPLNNYVEYWRWNGNPQSPTIFGSDCIATEYRCHTWIKNGKIENELHTPIDLILPTNPLKPNPNNKKRIQSLREKRSSKFSTETTIYYRNVNKLEHQLLCNLSTS